jgi:hypothetical protein
MTQRFTSGQLRDIRNAIDIAGVIVHLGILWKVRDGYFRFLCPLCSDFHTATNSATNLARCFRCARNFNPIDIVMLVNDASFIEAVRFLVANAGNIRSPEYHRVS